MHYCFLLALFLLLSPLSAHAQTVTATWTDNSPSAGKNNAETGTSVEHGTTTTGPFTEVSKVGPNITTFSENGLTVGATECMRVRAYNEVGFSDYSNVACTTVKTLPAPNEQVTVSCLQLTGDPTLVLWYKLDGNVTDSSGYNRTGSASGTVTYATGKTGQALVLTGADGRVTSPLTDTLTKSTIAAWTYRKGAGGGTFGRIVDKRTSGTEVEVLYNDDPAAVYRYLRCWSDACGSWTIPQPSLNVWHHIAVVYDGSSVANTPQMYVDGVAQTVTQALTPSGTAKTTIDPYVVGNRGVGDRGWNGLLDEVKIYNRLLSAADIQAAM